MTGPPYRRWLDSWDRQQQSYVLHREARFAAMFDVLAALADSPFTAVDLCCGPGSLSRRLLERFPQASVVAVDLDPVLVGLGRGAVGDAGGRLRWVEADVRATGWAADAGLAQVDAVLSTTALHYLTTDELTSVYVGLADLLRRGGVLVNADHLAYDDDAPLLQRVARQVQDRREAAAFGQEGVLDFQAWFAWLRQESEGVLDFAERERRFAYRAAQRDAPRPGLAGHRRALLDAGFRQVETVWQDHDDRVLTAVR